MKTFKPKFNIRKNNSQSLRLIPLGGVGDVTKNMYVYEYGDDIIIIDCGVGFPDEGMPGVDLVIPDISYLQDKKTNIRGIIITHGHDDHIGGLPFIWPQLNVPIYGQRLTAGLIKAKFSEFNLPKNKIIEVGLNEQLKLGPFGASFYQVAHSIPDSVGIVLDTPVGTIIHQADFKIDWTPPSGQVTDVGKVAEVGARGVKLLLIDCLRVEKPGFNRSEIWIEHTFEEAAKKTLGKLLITMTSSNISRMQQAINVAVKLGRKIAIVGRSFEGNFQVARDLGYLDVPQGIIITSDSISSFHPSKVLILIAGSQGQKGSSLERVANDEHKQVKLSKEDAILFSADPIPSTESAQSALIDALTRFGVDVYYSAIQSDLHVSGHAASEELKLMVSLIKPQFMLPIGGTYRHMKEFSRTFSEMGYKDERILNVENGDIINIEKDKISVAGKVEVKNVFVDGLGVGDVGSVILRDRQVMSEDGVVIVVVPFDQQQGVLGGELDIVSRGFIFEKEFPEILEEAKRIIKEGLLTDKKRVTDWRLIRATIEDKLEKFFYSVTERRPLILSIVVEV